VYGEGEQKRKRALWGIRERDFLRPIQYKFDYDKKLKNQIYYFFLLFNELI
tara:strand:- start:741 stop:893 length:153 start_codon:yes stop_codon:yes gene_type:complete